MELRLKDEAQAPASSRNGVNDSLAPKVKGAGSSRRPIDIATSTGNLIEGHLTAASIELKKDDISNQRQNVSRTRSTRRFGAAETSPATLLSAEAAGDKK